MQIDITINKGRGYVPADENREYWTDVNVIPIDSIYTPIRNVKYAVENFRVEQKTDYEKLVLCLLYTSISGRLNGAEMARSEMYKEGRTPLHTLIPKRPTLVNASAWQ